MLIVWLAQGRPHYRSMERGTIAYISDIGASGLKPLFIAGCSVTAFFFFLSLLSVRFHIVLQRRLENWLDILSLGFGTMGAVSLILLSVFDTLHHSGLHRLFLFLFMLGVILSAIFTTIEYRRLGKTYAEQKVLRYSYNAKRFIFSIEFLLSIAFGVSMYKKKQNAAAILEWVIAFIFTFYVLSFFFDLRPSAGTQALRVLTNDGRMEGGNGSGDLEGGLREGSAPNMTEVYGVPVAPVDLNEGRSPPKEREGDREIAPMAPAVLNAGQ